MVLSKKNNSMLTDGLNKSGNGTLYFIHQNEYQNKNEIGKDLNDQIDLTIITITPSNVRIYKGKELMDYLEQIVKSEGIRAIFNFFKYNKAFQNCSMLLKIIERSNDNKKIKCKSGDRIDAFLTINHDSILLKIQNKTIYNTINNTNYILYHGSTDSLPETL